MSVKNYAIPTKLDLTSNVTQLTLDICNIPSVSKDETLIANLVYEALSQYDHLHLSRLGNNIVARTELGRAQRVIIAGHLDTVPIAKNLPATLTTIAGIEHIVGRGSVDMKGGVAVQLALAAALREPSKDITWVFYDCEEIASEFNGLGKLVAHDPEKLQADFAILGEPTNATIEAGCNGTLRVLVKTKGITAHSARSWMGKNAIHLAADILEKLSAYDAATVMVDGLAYREGLNAVKISGGIAGNVIPDECIVTINYRFAPDKSPAQALQHVQDVFVGYEIEVDDIAAGARPGLNQGLVQDFVQTVSELTGSEITAKEGWTDVSRFTALGIPAVNFGPGNPLLAHKDDERLATQELFQCYEALEKWLRA